MVGVIVVAVLQASSSPSRPVLPASSPLLSGLSAVPAVGRGKDRPVKSSEAGLEATNTAPVTVLSIIHTKPTRQWAAVRGY